MNEFRELLLHDARELLAQLEESPVFSFARLYRFDSSDDALRRRGVLRNAANGNHSRDSELFQFIVPHHDKIAHKTFRCLNNNILKGKLMANKISLPGNWVCDGKELKPKSGASSSNTWLFDGKEIKPKSGASSSNTWLWDGKELRPKSGSSSSNTWIIDGNKVKPKSGASFSNTYETGAGSILIIAGQLVLRLW